jgi:hypothetical protein
MQKSGTTEITEGTEESTEIRRGTEWAPAKFEFGAAGFAFLLRVFLRALGDLLRNKLTA